jgi:hypothetical protein
MTVMYFWVPHIRVLTQRRHRWWCRYFGYWLRSFLAPAGLWSITRLGAEGWLCIPNAHCCRGENLKQHFNFFFFLQYWGLNSGPHACEKQHLKRNSYVRLWHSATVVNNICLLKTFSLVPGGASRCAPPGLERQDTNLELQTLFLWCTRSWIYLLAVIALFLFVMDVGCGCTLVWYQAQITWSKVPGSVYTQVLPGWMTLTPQHIHIACKASLRAFQTLPENLGSLQWAPLKTPGQGCKHTPHCALLISTCVSKVVRLCSAVQELLRNLYVMYMVLETLR